MEENRCQGVALAPFGVLLCGKSETFRTSSGGAAWASRFSPSSTQLTRALWPNDTTQVPRLDCHIRKGNADAPWALNKWNRVILTCYNSDSTTEKQVRSAFHRWSGTPAHAIGRATQILCGS